MLKLGHARARTGDCVQLVPTAAWGLLRPTVRRRPNPRTALTWQSRLQDSHNPSRACTRTCFNPEEELLSRIERYKGAVYWLQPQRHGGPAGGVHMREWNKDKVSNVYIQNTQRSSRALKMMMTLTSKDIRESSISCPRSWYLQVFLHVDPL